MIERGKKEGERDVEDYLSPDKRCGEWLFLYGLHNAVHDLLQILGVLVRLQDLHQQGGGLALEGKPLQFEALHDIATEPSSTCCHGFQCC